MDVMCFSFARLFLWRAAASWHWHDPHQRKSGHCRRGLEARGWKRGGLEVWIPTWFRMTKCRSNRGAFPGTRLVRRPWSQPTPAPIAREGPLRRKSGHRL